MKKGIICVCSGHEEAASHREEHALSSTISRLTLQEVSSVGKGLCLDR